jgi:hypothetical protein
VIKQRKPLAQAAATSSPLDRAPSTQGERLCRKPCLAGSIEGQGAHPRWRQAAT